MEIRVEENIMYFVITNNDGNTLIRRYTRAQLEKNLDERYWGDIPVFKSTLSELDTNYWEEGSILIIKGEIAVPKPKKVVEEWEL